MKKIALSILLLCKLSLADQGTKQLQLLIFNNPCIHLLDGLPLAIDGHRIYKMKVSLDKIKKMIYGQKIGNKNLGNYVFNTNQYCIKELVRIEKELKDQHHNTELSHVLDKAKKDFVKIYEPFVADMEPAKKLLISIIGEFCERRNLPNSMLLNWSHAKSGQEFKVFNQEVQSFVQLDIFLRDLTLFLSDLINSCPKGLAQYNELKKQLAESKKDHA